jgi:hypothetical protein
MNKNLYVSWLSNKLEISQPDGPTITEAKKKHLRKEINFLRAALAHQLHQQGRLGEIGGLGGGNDGDSYTLEPKSGLIDYRPDAPRASTKQPYIPPVWSYLGRNSLGIRENTDIEEGALAVIAKPTTALAVKPKLTRSDALAVIAKKGTSDTALATKPKTDIILHSYPTRRVPPESGLATIPSKGGLPTIPSKGGLPTKSPRSDLAKTPPKGGSLIKPPAGGSLVKPPVKPSDPNSEKLMTPMSGSSTNPAIDKRPKSKYTMSTHPTRSGGLAPLSVRPGTGDLVSESTMSSLINHHIDKFLNSRHGKLLKNEAQKVLTNRN